MAEYITFQPKDHFNTVLHTGTGSASSITGVGFQPDMVWSKQRNGTDNNNIIDAVRGVTKILQTDTASQEQTASQSLTSFDSDGFSVGTDNAWNGNSNTYCMWNWKAGTTSGLSGGTITPSAYSISTTSKFGIYKYTGNGSGSQTIAHGLGGTPTCVMFKQTSGAEQWRVHFTKAPNPYTTMFFLNGNAAASSQNNGLSAVSSTTITFGNDGAYNLNGQTYICYVFCDVPGFSKMGIYTGNGSADGSFIYTGFKPALLIRKRTDAINDWYINDNKRAGYNPQNNYLFPNTTQAESALQRFDFLSNGFKIRTTDAGDNANGGTYVYMAFAEEPLVSSNDIPGTTR